MPARTLLLRRASRPAAFTLLELIVTIVILGLLAALAIPTFATVRGRARDAAVLAELEAFHREVVAVAAFPGDGTITEADILAAGEDLPAATAGGVHAAGRLTTGPASGSQISYAVAPDGRTFGLGTAAERSDGRAGGQGNREHACFVSGGAGRDTRSWCEDVPEDGTTGDGALDGPGTPTTTTTGPTTTTIPATTTTAPTTTTSAPPAPPSAVSVASGAGNELVRDMITSPTGDAYVVGYFDGTMTVGATTLTAVGGTDVFVAKRTASGAWAWAASAGGSGSEQAVSITLDADGNPTVTGSFSGTATFGTADIASAGGNDAFVAGLTTTGTWTWAARAGGTGHDFARGAAATSDGGIVVTGTFAGTVAFDAATVVSDGGSDVFVAKHNPDGTWAWAARAGGAGADDVYGGVRVDSAGNIVASGQFSGTATFGTTTLTSAGLSDLFVAKLTGAGTWAWASRAGGTESDAALTMTVDADDHVVVAGYTQAISYFGDTQLISSGTFEAFAAKLTPTGTWVWAAEAGGSSNDRVWDVATAADGAVLVTGQFMNTATFGAFGSPHKLISAGGTDVFAARLSASGAWEWVARAGGTGNDVGYGIGGSDTVTVTGTFWLSATFGSTTLTGAGATDVFATALTSAGTWAS